MIWNRKVNNDRLLEKAKSLADLLEHRGWSIIMREFILPRLNAERIIACKTPMQLVRLQAEMRILKGLLNYIENTIKEGGLQVKNFENNSDINL